MNRFENFAKFCFLFLLILSAEANSGADSDREGDRRPDFTERAIGLTSSPWNGVRSWFNHRWMSLNPPDSKMDMDIPASAGGAMKEAAAKSFKTSEQAVANAAKSVGDAVHRTADKVKGSVSGSDPDAGGDL